MAAKEPTTLLRPTDRRNWVLQGVRLALHLGVILALTLRSAQIGAALHPFARALANEWIHLLFYVETTKRVPIWTATQQPQEQQQNYTVIAVTLPHFLLEIEEEIAANVEDEFFNSGFAARASSYPVGMLFTIEETKQHLHGAVANYFRLADIALDAYILAGGDAERIIPYPELVVRYENGSETVDANYTITGKRESEWPEPLQRDHTSERTREFFDHLDAMQLQFTVGMRDKMQDSSSDLGPLDEVSRLSDATGDKEKRKDKMLEWRVVFTYNLQSQGHLEVGMDYALRQHEGLQSIKEDEQVRDLPPVFFSRNTAFNFGLLALIYVYQCFEFALKWINSKSAAALRASSSSSPCSHGNSRHQVWIALTEEARDFWFWFILLLNVATMACFFEAWYHPYRLSLRDGLCLAFASCCALQWISLVRYLRVNTRFHILGLTLQRGLPRVAQFLAGVLPVFVGYVLFGTVMFGAQVPRFQSAGATATTLFSVANGDEIHDTFNAVAYTPWIGQIYVYSYMILFSYVVLMVCIGIIEDSFFSAVFPASWPSLEQSEREQQQQKEGAEHQQSRRRVQRELERVYQPDDAATKVEPLFSRA